MENLIILALRFGGAASLMMLILHTALLILAYRDAIRAHPIHNWRFRMQLWLDMRANALIAALCLAAIGVSFL